MEEVYRQRDLRGSCRPRRHLCPPHANNAAQCLYEEPGKTKSLKKALPVFISSAVHAGCHVAAVRSPNAVYGFSWKRNCNLFLACGGSPDVRSGQPISTSAPISHREPVHLACGSGEADRELSGRRERCPRHLV